MKVLRLVGNGVVVAILGLTSHAFRESIPQVSGIFAGMAVFWALCVVLEYGYGNLPIGAVISKTVFLRLGILPVIAFGASILVLLHGLSTTSFLISFLGMIAFDVSFMFASLAVIARNQQN